MKDRQFMVILGLVVAAGLVMGLIAFRMTGSSGGVATASVGVKAIGGDPNAPRPSAADEASAQPDEAGSSPDSQVGDQPETRDGGSPDVATPEPAPPPPPPPPVEPVETSGDTQS